MMFYVNFAIKHQTILCVRIVYNVVGTLVTGAYCVVLCTNAISIYCCNCFTRQQNNQGSRSSKRFGSTLSQFCRNLVLGVANSRMPKITDAFVNFVEIQKL